jgi:hypothetical protein
MSGNLRLRKTWPRTSDSSSPSRVTSNELSGAQAPAIPTTPEAERQDGPINASTEQSEEIDAARGEAFPPSSTTIIELNSGQAPTASIAPEAEDQDQPVSSSTERPDDDDTVRRGTVLPTKLEQLKWTVRIYIVTLLLSGALFFYIHAALVSQNSPLGPLLLDPSKTVLLVSALSQSFVLLLQFLLSCVFNNLRWQLAARDSGVLVSTFLGLSRATSLWGIVMLMRRRIHVIWGIHRYALSPCFDLHKNNIIQASISGTVPIPQRCP